MKGKKKSRKKRSSSFISLEEESKINDYQLSSDNKLNYSVMGMETYQEPHEENSQGVKVG
jgi:hypothetical protein